MIIKKVNKELNMRAQLEDSRKNQSMKEKKNTDDFIRFSADELISEIFTRPVVYNNYYGSQIHSLKLSIDDLSKSASKNLHFAVERFVSFLSFPFHSIRFPSYPFLSFPLFLYFVFV